MPDDSEAERETRVPCLACGGEYRRVVEEQEGRYRTEVCRWCVAGSMSPADILKYKTRAR